MSEQKTNIKLVVLIAVLFGLIVGGLCVATWKDGTIKTLKRGLAEKTIYAFVERRLQDMEFRILNHNDRVIGLPDEIQTYWNEKYLLKVFRVDSIYYIKIYTEWEGMPN